MVCNIFSTSNGFKSGAGKKDALVEFLSVSKRELESFEYSERVL